ncbi:hypothetical protein [Microcoleus sp. FACHB-1515]|nr:hypothetical protein [Microcoleus sp. FACHB-1515]
MAHNNFSDGSIHIDHSASPAIAPLQAATGASWTARLRTQLG